MQGYLANAPAGVGARSAWATVGGDGAQVRILDIEGGWRFDHEDIAGLEGGLVGGQISSEYIWIEHGTAVVGVLGGRHNGFGVAGMTPAARIEGFSVFPWNSTSLGDAITRGAQRLRPGDILLIEMQLAGPRFGFANRDDQRGYIAVEWWPHLFAAIRFAVNRGVIVVEAAGNGAENLSDALYDKPGPGFGAGWRNPFAAGGPDSGAIIVGAGAAATSFFPARSRLDFSNYGARLDAQGWGDSVATTGYGHLQGGDSRKFYTAGFGGTSSASPIVVGALAAVQGIRRAQGKAPLTPAQARDLLRSTGSAQQGAANERIGSLPDIAQMLQRMPL